MALKQIRIDIDNLLISKDYKDVYLHLIKKYKPTYVSMLLYDKYGYVYEENDLSSDRSNYQQKFRNDLIKRYKKCIISCNHPDICQASHIIPYSDPCLLNKYDIDNGLLLSNELHTLFDRKDLIINPETLIVKINEKYLIDNNMLNIYNGKKINVELNSKTIEYLKQYYK